MMFAGMMGNFDKFEDFGSDSGKLGNMADVMREMMWPYRSGGGQVFAGDLGIGNRPNDSRLQVAMEEGRRNFKEEVNVWLYQVTCPSLSYLGAFFWRNRPVP